MPSVDVRERLLTAAERLFAERGIDAVSLRQINAAASQKNVAASHYHFGSKEALIEAVIERRMSQVNSRRLAMLQELELARRTGDLHSVVGALVCPLAEQLDDGRDGGSHYVRLLAQVYGDPRIRIAKVFRGRYGRSVRRIEDLVYEILANLPPEIVAARFALVTGQMIHSLADWARFVAAARRASRLGRTALYVGNLIDSISGALSAPLSAATRELLRESGRRRA